MQELGCIWVLDDEEAVVAMVAQALRLRGWDARLFVDPVDCLNTLRSVDASECPDVLVMDLMMEKLHGFELLQHLQSDDDLKTISVVVLTALPYTQVAAKALKNGAVDVIQKPFSVADLVSRVRGHVKNRRLIADLEERRREADFLSSLSKTLNQNLNPREVLVRLVEETSRGLNVEKCSLVLIEEPSKDPLQWLQSAPRCRLIAASDDRNLRDLELDVEAYPEIQAVLRTQAPCVVDDVSSSSLLAPVSDLLSEKGVRSLALFPMKVEAEFVGILFLKSTRACGYFTETRLRLAEGAASVAAVALRNANMMDEIRSDRERLDRALRDLRRTKGLLSEVIDASFEAIIAADTQGNILVFNSTAEEVLGYKGDWARQRLKVWDLYVGDGARDVMRGLRSEDDAGVGRFASGYVELCSSRGEKVPVSMRAAILYDKDNHERATMGMFVDLREKLAMQERLDEANAALEEVRRQVILGQVAGAAAHELSQPITGAMGCVELLRMHLGAEDAKVARRLDVLDGLLKRCSVVIKRLGQLESTYRTKEYVGGSRIVDLDWGDGEGE